MSLKDVSIGILYLNSSGKPEVYIPEDSILFNEYEGFVTDEEVPNPKKKKLITLHNSLTSLIKRYLKKKTFTSKKEREIIHDLIKTFSGR